MTTTPELIPPMLPEHVEAADDMMEFGAHHQAELAALDAAARESAA